MLLMLILLIHCAGWVAADSCGYSNQPIPKTRCADLCLPASPLSCICGEAEEKLLTYFGPKHCCVDHAPLNQTGQCFFASNGDGKCPEAKVLDKAETCKGYCFNDYHNSKEIGADSHFNCGDKCVPAWKICRGYSACQDGSDVTACNENLTCAAWRGGWNLTHLQTGLSDNHFYCSYGDNKNNGKYDTITRNDEDNLDIRRQKVKIDYSSLKECTLFEAFPGLSCSGGLGGCVPNYAWCVRDESNSCDGIWGKFTTDNQGLCANTTFWRNNTCDQYYGEGTKASLGRRCSGGAQHCITLWYLSANYFYEVALIRSLTFTHRSCDK